MADTPLDAYTEFGNDIDNWIEHSACLYGCARLLMRYSVMFGEGAKPAFRISESHVVRGAALLRAFSLECLLKALWLKRGHSLVRGEKYVGIPGINNHDLAALADKVSFPLKASERKFLRRLTLWGEAGRYPVEARFTEEASVHLWTDGYERTFKVLAKRLLELVAPEAASAGVLGR